MEKWWVRYVWVGNSGQWVGHGPLFEGFEIRPLQTPCASAEPFDDRTSMFGSQLERAHGRL